MLSLARCFMGWMLSTRLKLKERQSGVRNLLCEFPANCEDDAQCSLSLSAMSNRNIGIRCKLPLYFNFKEIMIHIFLCIFCISLL
jgi:hypothetical protein